nr:hypothetical protein Iba_scaffold64318CG0010 [Ipomoea batatas]GMD14447.1 hypothetical protein Iba_chr07bCG6490 [Ipomoea batatas]GMD16128.1 hypothetical protein Iba_chr07cCG6410 [Ipomoea batatas]GMD19228.1 hypothetical protein Iba_chr07eCG6250 [Ipomoea batatas]
MGKLPYYALGQLVSFSLFASLKNQNDLVLSETNLILPIIALHSENRSSPAQNHSVATLTQPPAPQAHSSLSPDSRPGAQRL